MAERFATGLLEDFRAGRSLGEEIRSGFGGRPTVAQQTAQSGLARSLLQEQLGQSRLTQSQNTSRLQDAEFARFTERSNLESVFEGAIQASRFTNEPSQNQFLEARIAEGQRQGRDMQDTIELRQTPFDQRAPILKTTIDLGFQAGLGRRPPALASQAGPVKLQRFKGVDAEGDDAFFTFNPETREVLPLAGVDPIPPTGERITVGPEGTTIERGVRAGAGRPFQSADAKGVRKNVLQDLADNEIVLDQLSGIAESFNPELMTVEARLFNQWLGAKDKSSTLQSFFGKLTPDDRQKLKNRTTFENRVRRAFNAYRRQITGAAASEKEMADILESMFNQQQGPIAFKASFDSFVDEIQRNQRLRRRVLREGRFGDDFQKADGRAGRRLDFLMDAGQDDNVTPDQVAEELQDAGFSLAEIGRVLASEGY